VGASYGFNGVLGIASDGIHVWVTNNGGSVTELDAPTGAHVKLLSKSRYGFASPGAVCADRGRVWVANRDSDSVTEFPA
jgi:DNA-binding beta-propeller fold protein YncE